MSEMVHRLLKSPLAAVGGWGAAEVRTWFEQRGVPRDHTIFQEVADGQTLLMLVEQEGDGDEAGHANNAAGASLLGEYLADLPGGGRFLASQIEIELLGLRRLVHLARVERRGV